MKFRNGQLVSIRHESGFDVVRFIRLTGPDDMGPFTTALIEYESKRRKEVMLHDLLPLESEPAIVA